MAEKKYMSLERLQEYDDLIKAEIDSAVSGKSDSGHTHKYAGSSSVGGAATSANKLNTDAGSATQPVYFEGGVPKATTHTLGKSVPSDAKFTDTVYTLPEAGTSLGGVKSGGDVTISAGVITINDDSHNHTIANVDNLQTSLDGKAPTSHASSATTYGIGTSSNYGHVKLSDSTSSTSSTSAGIAATPAAVKAAYDLANGKANSSHTHSGSDITSGTVAAARLPVASDSAAGIVNTDSQSFKGVKTFTNNINVAGVRANTANTVDIGTSSAPFKGIYVKDLKIAPQTVSGSAIQAGRFTLEKEGTTTVDGVARLTIGNQIKSGSAGNAEGYIEMYNTINGSAIIKTSHEDDRNIHIYLPENGGTLLTDDDLTLSNLGLTATAAELNYVDGLTSNIQTQLDGKASYNHTHDYLPLTGGTISGVITTTDGDVANRDVTTGGTYYYGGTSFDDGAFLGLYGKDQSNYAGQFRLKADDGENFVYLEGMPSGQLKWNNKTVATLGTNSALAIADGGTGMRSNPSMLVNLASTSAAGVFATSPRPGVAGTLGVSNGGTGHTSFSNGYFLVGAGSGAIESLSPAKARAAMGLGETTGVLAVEKGGTGHTSFNNGYFLVGSGSEAIESLSPAQVLSTIGALNKDGDTTNGELILGSGQALYAITTNGTRNVVNGGSSGNIRFGSGSMDNKDCTVHLQGNNVYLDSNNTIRIRAYMSSSDGIVANDTFVIGCVDANNGLCMRPNKANTASGQLGTSSYMFKNIYCPNGVSTSSDRRLKTDICEDFTALQKVLIELTPVTYKLKNDTDAKLRIGFIAQDVENVFKKYGYNPDELALLQKDTIEADSEMAKVIGDTTVYSLNYSEFITLNTAMIQKQQNEIDDLKQEIENLKSFIKSE